MWKDPIVEEIHAIRRQIAKECNYDLKQIVERLRKKEKAIKKGLFSRSQEKELSSRLTVDGFSVLTYPCPDSQLSCPQDGKRKNRPVSHAVLAPRMYSDGDAPDATSANSRFVLQSLRSFGLTATLAFQPRKPPPPSAKVHKPAGR